MPINYGILQAQPQTQGRTQVVNNPNSQGLDGSFQGIGDVLQGAAGLLKGTFGPNPVSQANAALKDSMAQAGPQSVLQSILPSSMQSKPQPQQAQPGGLLMGPKLGLNDQSMGLPQAQQLQQLQQMRQNMPQNQQIPQGSPIQSAIQAAKATYPDDPVRAKLAAAQAIQESGLSGRPSQLATQHNNYFGIKGSGNAGNVAYHSKEHDSGGWSNPVSNFASYKTPEDSFQAHKALMSKDRYKAVMQAQDFESAAKAVQHSGYATDPNYSNQLIKIGNTYLSNM